MLSRIARREALTALAEALAEEARSKELSRRSRKLADGYMQLDQVSSGSALSHQVLFAGELAKLASSAEDARGDAARQAAWQSEALSVAEQRFERLSHRSSELKSEIEAAQTRQEQTEEAAMARTLQGRTRRPSRKPR